MKGLVRQILIEGLTFQHARFFIPFLCVLTLFALYHSVRCSDRRQQRRFWGGILASVVIFIGTIGLHIWRLPHGLSAQYYANPTWEETDLKLERYFEPDGKGRRVDRFIDFNANDFNNRYPFSGNPFSVQWQGSIYVPVHGARVTVTSNFGTWLYLDDKLVDGHHRLDFGTPEARAYLREGWSYDEFWNNDPDQSFVWGIGRTSDFYLGLDKLDEYTLFFRCIPLESSQSPGTAITVTVNGHELQTVSLEHGWQTYAVRVPQAAIQNKVPGFVRITFAYSHVRPSGNSQERRELAAAFDFAVLQKSSLFQAEHSHASSHTPAPLSPGVHHVTLKALQNPYNNPYIRLEWRLDGQVASTTLLEDYLFPMDISPERIRSHFWQERIWLASLIIAGGLWLVWQGRLFIVWGFPLIRKALWRKECIIPAIICALAFGVRGLFLLNLRGIDPNFDILPDDTDHLSYLFFARGFLRGYWPGLSHAPFYFGPLISWYFIFCHLLFGEHLVMVRMMTMCLSTLSILLIYDIARRIFHRQVALLAAAGMAANGILIFYDTSVVIAPLMTFFSIAALWFLSRVQERLSFRDAAGAGVALGLAALARSNVLLLLLLAPAWLRLGVTGTTRRKFQIFSVLAASTGVTILPVTLYNYLAFTPHEFVLTTSGGGINLWIGNNLDANGMYSFNPELLAETQERIQHKESTYIREVVRFISEHPWEYLTLEYRKLKHFWRGYEIDNLLSYYFMRDASAILRLPWLNFVLLGPLGIVGMAMALRQWKTAFWLYGYVGMHCLTGLIFFVLGRYRVPAVPILSIFAAYAVWQNIQWLNARQWKAFGISLAAFALLYVCLNVPYAREAYQHHYGTPLPWINILRYWDLFHVSYQ